jgi:hypothetical protein
MGKGGMGLLTLGRDNCLKFGPNGSFSDNLRGMFWPLSIKILVLKGKYLKGRKESNFVLISLSFVIIVLKEKQS